ncbi:hypothetical protein ACOJUR_00720 [Alicyclobacillus tolerans]|uniref:hypothetical protein n=1 Tax=Alicyclobacillus tolerans TaxID=90970 RepID=UPI00101AE0C9|nr:hypothetical protein [Alicyclobacillus montanus]
MSYRKAALLLSHFMAGSHPQSWMGGFASHDNRRFQVATLMRKNCHAGYLNHDALCGRFL